MKIIYTGLESSGKTLILADKVMELIARNQKWHKKYGFIRKIYSNLRLNNEISKKYKNYLVYWTNCNEIIGLTGVDVIWDEISTDFSAMKKDPLDKKINRWLRQGAKQGVHIYATAQEFHDVHLDFRRRVKYAYKLSKVIGSQRSGCNLPPIKYIWGLIMLKELVINPYNELMPQYKSIIPSFIFITRSLCEIFDTNQVVSASDNDYILEHVVKRCDVCGLKKISHN